MSEPDSLGRPQVHTASLRIKTAASNAPATTTLLYRYDQTSNNTYVTDGINECPNQPAQDAVPDNYDKTTRPTPTFSPPASVLPLMPAMIGPNEICAAEIWSNDPNFMIYCYKIKPCTHRTPHDWRVCPWAHPNERAARRCPRQFVYASVPCVNARSGRLCAKGPACEYSHNVTEYWLHPTRYRAEWCSLGLKCNRRLCFFAHSDVELRSQPTAPPPVVSSIPRVQLADLVPTPKQSFQQHHHPQPQPSAGESIGAIANGSTFIQHDLLQLLMSATLTVSNASLADSLLRPPPPISRQELPQPVSVPAFYDLLGTVAPMPPAPAILQPVRELVQPVEAADMCGPIGPANPRGPPNASDAGTAQLIVELMKYLPAA
jgi:hypothetical protein